MRYLVAFFMTIGLILGTIFSKYFAIFLIFFSNIFFTAYSDAKIIVFLLYLALLFLMGFIWKSKTNIKKSQVIQLHISLFVLALASVFSYVYITHAFKLPFNSVSTFVYSGGHDSTVGPFHIHTFKPVFTWLLTLIGIYNVPYYGSGLTFFQAFRELQPFYMASFFLLLYTVYLFVRYGLHLGEKQGIFFLVIYSIFSYGVIKALVDGGPLWYEAYLNYALFCLLIFFSKGKKNISWKKILTLIFIGFIGNYFILILLRALVNSTLSIQLLQTRPIAEYGLFFVGLGLILLNNNKKKYIFFILFCFIAGMYFYLNSSPTVIYIRYGMKTISPQDKITLFSTKPLALPLVAKEGRLYLYKYNAKKKQNIFSVISSYGHLFYREVAVEGKTCDPKKITSQSMTVSVSQGKLKDKQKINSPFFLSFRIEQLSPKKNTYKITYNYKDCFRDPNEILFMYLQRLGFYSFVTYQ